VSTAFKRILIITSIMVLFIMSVVHSSAPEKKRILVVSSYHREYRWSQETNEGLCAALKEIGYFDNDEQISEYTKNDYVETSKTVVKKLWMNTKKKKLAEEIAGAVSKITKLTNDFKPDIIMLGDDNAANYIGNQFLDAEIPIVFWGVNNTPVKYGLVDSIEKPGHNVTGVYQTGYYKDSLELLKKIAPKIKTFAILSDDTSSGRSHVKKIERLAHKDSLPVKLVETVVEGNYKEWKRKALELQDKVDALFIAQYSGLMDEEHIYVSTEKVTEWYIKNIKIPEAAVQGQFVKQGMLCSADDSGYNQGHLAVHIVHDILTNGKSPATYSTVSPKRGPLMVSKRRAEMLGISFTDDMGIEEYH